MDTTPSENELENNGTDGDVIKIAGTKMKASMVEKASRIYEERIKVEVQTQILETLIGML